MRRWLVGVVVVALVVVLPGGSAVADHDAPAFTSGHGEATANAGGEGADWEFITSFKTGNPHTDIEFFSQNGQMYVSVGTLAGGPNGAGQTIFQLTNEDGEVDPGFVSAHPSATCPSVASGVTGLQHDVEAMPKGDVLLNTDFGNTPSRANAQLLVDTSDAPGRCHDNGFLGFTGTAPQGGLELIDVTDIENPVEIALTSHIGQAHTVNVDPKRPHIAYAVSSDQVGFSDGARNNENPEGEPLDLDGWEVVDFSSCMNFPEDTTVEAKRGLDEEGNFLEDEGCRPEVYRYRYPTPELALGHTARDSIGGCHELELYPDDRLVCAGLGTTMLFDVSGAFDDNGTPNFYLDDTPVGEPLPCRVRSSTSDATPTDAPIIDCVVGGTEEEPIDLTVPAWLGMGAPSLEGVEHISTAHHIGPRGEQYDPSEDISISHEAELTHSEDFVLATDERGGAVVPPGAACPTPFVQPPDGNGGIHAYATDRMHADYPAQQDEEGNFDPEATAEAAWEAYARTGDGEKAIYRATVRVPSEITCTAHVFHQIPGQNRIFMGWYTQGTQVVDFVEHPDGTFEWQEAGWWIPTNANQWVSEIFAFERNDDGSFTYWGATGDFVLSQYGRNTVDIYKVTMPPPPEPAGPVAACEDDEVPAPGFEDVARNAHRPNIDCIAWYEITLGTTAETYSPRQDVTRAQMASFLARLAVEGGLTLPSAPNDAFEDDDGTFHEDNINALAELGIVRGVGDTDGDGRPEYAPHDPVRRDQMAAFIARTHRAVTGSLPADPPDAFDDDDGNTHEPAVNALADLGVIQGSRDPASGDMVFRPALHVSRAQMASFIANDLRVFVDAGEAIGGGARVELDSYRTGAGGTLNGTVTTRKQFDGLTANGCGLEEADVDVAGDGSFQVTIAEEEPGNCRLTLTATTRRAGSETDGQVLHETFDVTIQEAEAEASSPSAPSAI